MANEQVTIRATSEGVDPAWVTLRSANEADAVAREILANELSRRFSTAKGTYFTDPSYGLVLEDILGSGITSASLQRLLVELKDQAIEDERVLDAKAVLVSITGPSSAQALKVKITVVPRLGEPFSLTLGVSGVRVSLLKVER